MFLCRKFQIEEKKKKEKRNVQLKTNSLRWLKETEVNIFQVQPYP